MAEPIDLFLLPSLNDLFLCEHQALKLRWLEFKLFRGFSGMLGGSYSAEHTKAGSASCSPYVHLGPSTTAAYS